MENEAKVNTNNWLKFSAVGNTYSCSVQPCSVATFSPWQFENTLNGVPCQYKQLISNYT